MRELPRSAKNRTCGQKKTKATRYASAPTSPFFTASKRSPNGITRKVESTPISRETSFHMSMSKPWSPYAPERRSKWFPVLLVKWMPQRVRTGQKTASRARKPRRRGAAIRSSIWVTTCSAVARPKRASIRSAFSMVPVASASEIRPPEALDRVSVSVSSPSSWLSSSTATSTVTDGSPASSVSVPLAAV